METSAKKVWFITGVSRGFGKALAEAVLENGDIVIGTSRNGKADIDPQEGQLKVLRLDVRDRESVEAAVQEAFALNWRLDVVVNNAGFGLLGAMEESTPNEVNDVMDVNFFGTVNVTQAVLPYLRDQRSGHILNISSIGGIAPRAGYSFYAASKFAVEGLSISLAQEVRELGIKVTLIEPGAFRTDFLSDQSIRYTAERIDDYTDNVGEVVRLFEKMNGKQIGDPVKAAQVIMQVVNSPEPPLHLLLGSDAYERTTSHLAAFAEELDKWRHLSLSTDFAGLAVR